MADASKPRLGAAERMSIHRSGPIPGKILAGGDRPVEQNGPIAHFIDPCSPTKGTVTSDLDAARGIKSEGPHSRCSGRSLLGDGQKQGRMIGGNPHPSE